MAEEGEAGSDSEAGAAQKKPGESGQMGMMFIFLFTMLIMFNPSLRSAMGSAMGGLLYPVIGFKGSYPVPTILCAALITGTLSVIGRHYFTDWAQMGKTQKIQKALGKEMRAAQLKNDVARLAKLREFQMAMSKDQMGTMSSQMKPTMYMMLVFIAIFTWLWIFIGGLPNTTLSLPWNFNADFNDRGPVVGLMPLGILLYMFFSLPYSQAVQYILKTLTFKKKLEAADGEGDD